MGCQDRWHDKNAGTYLHEESSLIRKRLEEAAICRELQCRLDTTGDSSVDKLRPIFRNTVTPVIQVKAYYATVDPDGHGAQS
jgi:hypothetical protein